MFRWEVYLEDDEGYVHQFYSTRSFRLEGDCRDDLADHLAPDGPIEQEMVDDEFTVLDVQVIMEV
jgi:hypothetical protein